MSFDCLAVFERHNQRLQHLDSCRDEDSSSGVPVMYVTMRKSSGELQAICITQLRVESLILSACFCNLSLHLSLL